MDEAPATGIEWIARLLDPKPEVEGELARRHARYTTLSLIVLLPVGVLGLILSLYLSGDDMYADEILILAGIACFALLLPLSRGQHSPIAAYATLLVTSGGVWASWYFVRSTPNAADTLFYLALPVTMATLLLASKQAAWFGVANVTAVLVIVPLSQGDGSLADALTRAFFVTVIGALGVNSARIRERDLARLEDATDRLKEQEAKRLRMLNTIAHDLASPLTPLKLQVKMIPKDKPMMPMGVAIIERNLAQMERLVTDVKDLARLDAGAMKLDKKPTDLADVAKNAVETFEADATQRGLRLLARVDGPLPIEGDPERLTQVVYNLVTNALKFTPPGGTVTLSASRSQEGILLQVADSGRGLTSEEMSRLFQPFSQVHERSEVKERGTGLGLYIARGIAEAHGGRLSVQSDGRGSGSTFTLALPGASATA